MLAGLCTWYMGCLDSFPLQTKSLTSAVISLLGDGGAQFHEERTRERERKLAGLAGRDASLSTSLKNFSYNRRRGLTNFADSALICGPMLHYGYGWLESAIPVVNPCVSSASSAICSWSASHAAAAHVLIDDFVFDAIFIAIMFVSTGVGEGCPMKEIADQCRQDYFPAVKTMWKTSFLLMPLEFCLFRFLPLRLRVLGMNLIEIVWDAVVSYMIHKRRKGHPHDPPKLVDAYERPKLVEMDSEPELVAEDIE